VPMDDIPAIQTSVHHVEREDKGMQAELRFSYKRRYVPCIMTMVWSCGHVANVRKLMSYESYDDGKYTKYSLDELAPF
jgi:hypothetical protein